MPDTDGKLKDGFEGLISDLEKINDSLSSLINGARFGGRGWIEMGLSELLLIYESMSNLSESARIMIGIHIEGNNNECKTLLPKEDSLSPALQLLSPFLDKEWPFNIHSERR